jgi:glycosyltransferase involved in cell wall biosynthesis
VCIAAYQGERYIAQQLRSILPQLSASDEVIVMDDASSDGTFGEVASLQDPRITLTRSEANRGILRAFEAALARATGDIIFLSDQDDLWLAKKVETVLDAFAEDSNLMLIASDATLIDEDGNTIGDSYYARRGKFRAGLIPNVLICRFLGCTMTFRSALLRSALPFPQATRVHHDVWLGCINALTGGKTKYIAEPLVEYRRHSTNVTGRVKFSTFRRLQMRYQLCAALLKYWVGTFRMGRNGSTTDGPPRQ